ncbi:MAG: tetratricopeptide repeat protein [Armatimonadota bacterium]
MNPNPKLPRWLIITLIAVLVVGIAIGIFFAFRYSTTLGWIISGVLLAIIAIFAAVTIPPLYKLYKFQKYFKQHEATLGQLPTLMQSGRTQEALMRFEGVMKQAPDNAFLTYMQAFFLQSAGELPRAMSAANKALAMAKKDPSLPMMLQQMAGQYGQPTTVEGFIEQLEDLKAKLEPRVSQMRERKEKAVSRRKKKSR